MTKGSNHNEDKKRLGARMNEALKLRGMTQEQAGIKMGKGVEENEVEQGVISKWVRGQHAVSGPDLQRFAEAVGVSVAWLNGETDDPSPRKPGESAADEAVSIVTSLVHELLNGAPTRQAFRRHLPDRKNGLAESATFALAVSGLADHVEQTYGRPWATLSAEEQEDYLSILSQRLAAARRRGNP